MSRKLKVKTPRSDESGLMGVTESTRLPEASLQVKIQKRVKQFWRREMSPTQGTPENANAATTARLATRPRIAADANDVMRDQLEWLIDHAENGVCGCEQCDRYLRARALLLMQ